MEYWSLACKFHITVLLWGFIGLISIVPSLEGAVRFTKTPPHILYVSNGTTARFVWKYLVANRSTELSDPSITWDFKRKLNESTVQLAYENKVDKSWEISVSCPATLRTRISRVDGATLLINRTTLADNGFYGCNLFRSAGGSVNTTTQLIVTVRPQFVVNVPPVQTISEGRDLDVQCKASGIPLPKVSWRLKTPDGSKFQSEGTGSTNLHISNIRREQAGVYECTATNNPNEAPIRLTLTVIVHYPPVIDVVTSSRDVMSWPNNTVYLRCMVSGRPTPKITWFAPGNKPVTSGVMIAPGGGILAVETKADKDYGEYECKAQNHVGRDEYRIQLIRLDVPGPPIITMATDDIEPRSITVRWTRPKYRGGLHVKDYRVRVSGKSPREGITGYSVVISGLNKDTEYVVGVTARNDAGYGNETTTTIRTNEQDAVVAMKTNNTAIAACVPIIVLLLIVIVVLAVYIWRLRKRQLKKYAVDSSIASDNYDPEKVIEIPLDNTRSSSRPEDSNKNYRNHNGNSKSGGYRRKGRRPLQILTSIEEESSGEGSHGESEGLENLVNEEEEEEDLDNKNEREDNTNNDTTSEQTNGKTVVNVSVDVHNTLST